MQCRRIDSRFRLRTHLLLAFVACGALASTLPAEQPAPPSPREEFAEICRQMKASDLPWYGELPATELSRRLAEQWFEPLAEAKVRYRLGVELLKLSRPGEAVETLQRGIELLDQASPNNQDRWGMLWFLGLSYLQLAEDQNCVERHNQASCLLPIRPEGVHSKPDAARKAADVFLAMVAHEPKHIQAAWLFDLAKMLAGEYPAGVPPGLRLPEKALLPETDFPRWLDRAPDLGINALDNAGGAVMDDFDGDGLLDLVSTTWAPCGGMKAFRNDGHGGFADVAEHWGLAEQLGGLNLTHADFDNDGDLDLLVLRGGWMLEAGQVRRSLLRNDLATPARRFTDVTHAAGLAAPAYPTQAGAWGDYDLDGDLDLYLANEVNGKGEPYPSLLFRNHGDGTFIEVAEAAGVANRRYGKGAAWGDYDGDGDPDLYVSNIGGNRLYRNRGDGTFVDVATELKVTGPKERSFATWFFDYDNDGDLDLWVNDYGAPPAWVTAGLFGLETPGGWPLLFRNDGAGSGDSNAASRFSEVSRESGITRPTLPMGSNYGDLDSDGFLDVYLGTGAPEYEAVMPNVVFHNTGGRFEEVTNASGMGHLQKGHGVAFGDLDNDGDQDLFHQLGGFYPGDAFSNALFENPTLPAGNGVVHWITLRLVGVKANRFGVGARIEVRVREAGKSRSIHLLAGSGGSFGGSSFQQEIGLGRAEAIEEVIVRWPGGPRTPGTVDRIATPTLDRFYKLVEGSATLVPLEAPRLVLGGQGAAPPPLHR